MKEKKNEGNYFNPLPRKEGDKSIVPLCALSTHFNPLPRKEGDRFEFFVKLKFCISIHSLVKRETTFSYCLKKAWAISIHSLVKRETQLVQTQSLQIRYFNPLPRKEGDGFTKTTQPTEPISIHSLVKRETCLCHQ